jgi:thymidylate synthase ThyX
MKLTGFFIGDGYHDRRYHNAVSFNLRKQREIAFLLRVVEECGLEWTLHGKKYYVTGSGLGDFLEHCYDDQRRKIIPGMLLQYGPGLLEALMEGLLNSDGSEDDCHHALYSTTSEPLKDQMYEVALKLGWAAYASAKRKNRIGRKSHKIAYMVHFNRTRLKPEVNKVTYRKQDGWEPYDGMVYCAEMPRNHVLYVRRNGRPVWSGNSVAEHAVLHIAVENVSRLAIECLESNRLASYTEKSTRYQMWGPESFYSPASLAGSRHAELYRQTCRRLFETYLASLDPVKRLMQAKYPRRENESDARWDGRLRSKYVDNCRFLLPASALANVGVTANARVLESAIRKLLSHPLEEVREIGAEVKRVSQAEVPTLVKYAEVVPYQAETTAALTAAAELEVRGQRSEVGAIAELVNHDPQAEDKFLAACLYRFGGASLADCRAAVAGMSAEQKAALAHEALGRLDKHDVPLRELEHVTYTFDAVMDQGGYFEIKRHRMMTQSPQRLTCDLGYAVPRALEEAGRRAEYDAAMRAAAEAYHTVAPDFPEEASYLVPNGFNRRVLMTLNLREAFHLCELRGAPGAHFSVRRTAGQIYEAIARVHPTLARYMRCRDNPHWEEIEGEFFVAVG